MSPNREIPLVHLCSQICFLPSHKLSPSALLWKLHYSLSQQLHCDSSRNCNFYAKFINVSISLIMHHLTFSSEKLLSVHYEVLILLLPKCTSRRLNGHLFLLSYLTRLHSICYKFFIYIFCPIGSFSLFKGNNRSIRLFNMFQKPTIF